MNEDEQREQHEMMRYKEEYEAQAWAQEQCEADYQAQMEADAQAEYEAEQSPPDEYSR